jgi:acetyl esterase/lipase
MLSKEAEKAKKKFQNLGTLINLLSINPKKLSKPKIISQRLNFNFIVPRLAKKQDGVVHEEISLGNIRTWKVTSKNSDPEKILLYFHGGAYVVGNPEAYFPMMSYLAASTGFTIYVPDYRLAPEHHYPSQLEDGVSCFEALIKDFGYSPQQIAFGGDSAGGNLALVTLLKLKEKDKELPCAVICMSPWADPAATGDTYNAEMCDRDPVLGPTFKKVFQKYGLDTYLTYYGTDELLLSDSRSLVTAFKRDGVEYEYKEWNELWHVFQMESYMPESRKSFELFSDFLNKHIEIKV